MSGLCAITTCGRKRSDPRRSGNSPYCLSHFNRSREYGDPLAGPPILDRRSDRAEYVIGEVEWFMSYGISPELIAAELGMKHSSVRDSLRRWKRPDLAEYFVPDPGENWAKHYLQTKRWVA